MKPESDTSVGLFVTCLVDTLRPAVGFASVTLLEQAGFSVIVPGQGCCGQANFNGGDPDGARHLATAVIAAFRGCRYVVAPSGSCAAMLKAYPSLFDAETAEHGAAVELAERTWELSAFLSEVARLALRPCSARLSVAVHDACTGLRELGIREQPRALLAQRGGVELRELAHRDACCGFGGTFCTKYSDISNRIGAKKLDDFHASGADCLVSTDLGCLLHLEGKAHRDGRPIRALHLAELLTATDAD